MTSMVVAFFKTFTHTYFQGSALSGTSVTPTLEVCTAAMLTLLVIGNWEVQKWCDVSWKSSYWL